jgi:hypothetical protein
MRVEALVGRTCIAISASEFATLTITRPPTNGEASLASLPVNAIYGWGHGSHVPLKVHFPLFSGNVAAEHNDPSTFSRSACVNPISIASAKYHNVAIMTDGLVYTWGISSESLGLEKMRHKGDNSVTPKKKGQHQHSAIASPQLVTGMLPENGGGRAVAVSASESHTAVVTSDGHLYTWGSSYGNNALGHKGVKWQPSPRKVKRVHRAVGLAAAKEHTALLIATSFPSRPQASTSPEDTINNPLSLKDSVAVEISRNVDCSNVIPVAGVAQSLNSKPLLQYCEKFVRMNLDGVLAASNIADLESFWTSTMSLFSFTDIQDGNDSRFHPVLYKLAQSNDWMQNSLEILKSLKGCIDKKQRRHSKKLMCSKLNPKETDVIQTEIATTPVEHEVGQTTVSVKADEKLNPRMETSPMAKSPGDAKYYCSECAVFCPDSDSYTLHISGRKHRNRLHHSRQEEEKEVAEQMMNMKRMQLMSIDHQNSGRKSHVSSVPFNPPIQDGQGNSLVKSSVWASPQPTKQHIKGSLLAKPRSNSLLGIMNEELQKSSSDHMTPKHYAKSMSTATPASGKKLSFSPQPAQP